MKADVKHTHTHTHKKRGRSSLISKFCPSSRMTQLPSPDIHATKQITEPQQGAGMERTVSMGTRAYLHTNTWASHRNVGTCRPYAKEMLVIELVGWLVSQSVCRLVGQLGR